MISLASVQFSLHLDEEVDAAGLYFSSVQLYHLYTLSNIQSFSFHVGTDINTLLKERRDQTNN